MLDGKLLDRHARILFPLPAVVFTLALLVFPVAYTVWVSLTNWNLTTGLAPRFVGLRSYATVVQDPRFWSAFVRTLYFTGMAVAAETVLGVIWALVLNRDFAGKGIVKTLLLLPLVATPVAIGISWTLFYEPTIGLANWGLRSIGLQGLNWLTDRGVVLPALALIDLWQWTPLIALITLAGLAGLSQEPYESARVDGANGWQIFWHITLPMVAPAVLTGVLLRSIDALKTFDIIYSTTLGGPSFASETLNIYSYNLSFNYFRLGQAAASLVFLFALVLSLSAAVSRLRRRIGV